MSPARFSRLGIVAVMILSTSCSDPPVAPTRRTLEETPRPMFSEGDPYCETHICDEGGGDPTVTYGFYSESVGDVNGAGESNLTLVGSAAEPYIAEAILAAVDCPPGIAYTGVNATLFPPGEPALTIVSSGFWGIIFGEMPRGYGRYNWPINMAAPTHGYKWPEVAGARWASVTNADAVCRLNSKNTNGVIQVSINVSFYRYNGVDIEYPVKRTSYDGGGGGGGGGSCHLEYVYLEIDYGDGTGWHTLWEGYANVCG